MRKRHHRVAMFTYTLAGAVVSAFLRLRLCLGGLDEAARNRIRERLGVWSTSNERSGKESGADGGPLLWIQAASVGEVMLVRALLPALRERVPGVSVLLTCHTATGRSVAVTLDCDEVRYFPVDYGPIVGTLLDRVRPSLIVFVETEIWPGILSSLQRRGVRAAFVNARISDRSYPSYLRLRGLLAPLLACVDTVCCRDPESAKRWLALGVSEPALILSGDMKYDGISAEEVDATVFPLQWPDSLIVLAASTHEGEEEVVLEAFDGLRAALPGQPLRLVLVPRHPDRATAVMRVLGERGIGSGGDGRRVQLWSEVGNEADCDVLLVDQVGVLRSLMKGASVVFMGGSLVPVGGHNLLEPAAFALPIAAGEHLANVEEQADALRQAGALSVVTNADDLKRVWKGWLDDPAAAAMAGEAGRDLLAANRGAVAKTTERLAVLLENGS